MSSQAVSKVFENPEEPALWRVVQEAKLCGCHLMSGLDISLGAV